MLFFFVSFRLTFLGISKKPGAKYLNILDLMGSFNIQHNCCASILLCIKVLGVQVIIYDK